MTLFYEGTDMTSYCHIRSAICHDRSGDVLDGAEIEVEDAEQWEKWGIKTDDRIEIRENEYTTGTLYLTRSRSENGRMMLEATSVKSAGRAKVYAGYQNHTLNELYAIAAAETGMEYALYGLDGKILYPWIIRNGESMIKMLSRITEWEGGKMKAVSGKITGISIEYAQNLPASKNLRVLHGQKGILLIENGTWKYGEFNLFTRDAYVTAQDTSITYGGKIYAERAKAYADIQTAGRWARGMLLQHNRKADSIEIESQIDLGYSGLKRIDITGDTHANGSWICDEADHDFINRTTWARLYRVIDTIQ